MRDQGTDKAGLAVESQQAQSLALSQDNLLLFWIALAEVSNNGLSDHPCRFKGQGVHAHIGSDGHDGRLLGERPRWELDEWRSCSWLGIWTGSGMAKMRTASLRDSLELAQGNIEVLPSLGMRWVFVGGEQELIAHLLARVQDAMSRI